MRKRLVPFVVALVALLPLGAAGAAQGTWLWPVVGPVTRAFDPPDTPYGSGHRGIDIATMAGTVIVAPAAGTVTFAGRIGANLFLTINHGGGVASTYSWVSGLLVRKGDAVMAGEPVARSGTGHPGDTVPSLHFGVKLDGAYVDPLLFLLPPSVTAFIRLVPLPAIAA